MSGPKVGIFLALGGVVMSAYLMVFATNAQANPGGWRDFVLRNQWVEWPLLVLALALFFMALREGQWFRRLAWKVWPKIVPATKSDVEILRIIR